MGNIITDAPAWIMRFVVAVGAGMLDMCMPGVA
jgi:hypothetical protein